MSMRVLLIIVLVIVVLAVVCGVMGSKRSKSMPARPPAFTGLLDCWFGALAPGFDIDDLQVTGATLKDRRITLAADQAVTLKVRPLPGADRTSCRNLELVLISPLVNKAQPEVVRLTTCSLNPPFPSDDFEPPDTGQVLPNGEIEPDPFTGKIAVEDYRSCTIPVFRGGGTVVLTAQRACEIEIR
jgi:hypothetical protein